MMCMPDGSAILFTVAAIFSQVQIITASIHQGSMAPELSGVSSPINNGLPMSIFCPTGMITAARRINHPSDGDAVRR